MGLPQVLRQRSSQLATQDLATAREVAKMRDHRASVLKLGPSAVLDLDPLVVEPTQARRAGRAARSRGRCRVRSVVVQHARALILKFKFSTGAAKASRAEVSTRTRLYYRYEI